MDTRDVSRVLANVQFTEVANLKDQPNNAPDSPCATEGLLLLSPLCYSQVATTVVSRGWAWASGRFSKLLAREVTRSPIHLPPVVRFCISARNMAGVGGPRPRTATMFACVTTLSNTLLGVSVVGVAGGFARAGCAVGLPEVKRRPRPCLQVGASESCCVASGRGGTSHRVVQRYVPASTKPSQAPKKWITRVFEAVSSGQVYQKSHDADHVRYPGDRQKIPSHPPPGLPCAPPPLTTRNNTTNGHSC